MNIRKTIGTPRHAVDPELYLNMLMRNDVWRCEITVGFFCIESPFTW